MALSPRDPHSYARPELERVTQTHLELNVDFDRKVLQGKAILTIESIPPNNEVILDSYGLVISSVTNFFTGSGLEYQIGQCGTFGSKFTIHLPYLVEGYNNRYRIQIEYETSPNSPALYWLKPGQTADEKYPFLLSNTKYTYARAVFPCQDTPSVKFTYSATISVPMGFKVLMSAFLRNNYMDGNTWSFMFFQIIPVPSYALIIVVGVLKYIPIPDSRIGVWTENKYKNLTHFFTFLSRRTEEMLQFAENLCGVYPWGSLNICILPPSVSHVEIECPCLIFMSPTLLRGDISLISSIARYIPQNWRGILVSSANYHHLWLNKCFSMFIYGKILRFTLSEYIRQYIFMRDFDELRSMIQNFYNTGLQQSLLSNLVGLLPDESVKYVPYKAGHIFLFNLHYEKKGTSILETFLKCYLSKFVYKSITTDDWRSYLHAYFHGDNSRGIHTIEYLKWSTWFQNPNHFPPQMFGRREFMLEEVCISLAERWIHWNIDTESLPFKSEDIEDFCDLQKIYFLNYLRTSYTIPWKKKMYFMASIYLFDNQNDEIRFAWLRLCIKNRMILRAPAALKFAIKFCSPKFTYPIFQDLYEWSDIRNTVIAEYTSESWKMLDEIKEKVDYILHVNETV